MLGVQLIFRGSRYGGLTPEGQRRWSGRGRLVGDARTFQRGDDGVSRHGLSGHLRLAVIPTALTWAGTAVGALRRTAPQDPPSPSCPRTSVQILKMLENLEKIDAGLS